MPQNRPDGLAWARAFVLMITVVPWIACVPGSFQFFPECSTAPPTIIALLPNQVKAGSSEFALSIMGSDFHSSSVVTVNGNQRTSMTNGDHEMSVLIAAGDIAQPGVVQIVVVTPQPKDSCGGGASNIAKLTVTP